MKLQGWTVVKNNFPFQGEEELQTRLTWQCHSQFTWRSRMRRRVASHVVWLSQLTQVTNPHCHSTAAASQTWRVHTWRMFSLLSDNHSSTILLGPYTTKPIFALFPTTLRIILHFSASSDPDLMKIHRNKVYHTKLIGPHSHFTWYKWDNLDGQAPNVITDEFAISNFQLWTQKQDLGGMATFGKLILTSGKSRRPRSTEELIFISSTWSNLFAEMKTLFQMKNPHEWQWGQRHIDPEHVMCCKQRSKASGFDNSSRIFTWNTCLTRSLACSGIAEQERATFAFCQACWPFESLDSNESLGPKLCCWTVGACNTWHDLGWEITWIQHTLLVRPDPPLPVDTWHCQLRAATQIER